jgi:hypothetical protein
MEEGTLAPVIPLFPVLAGVRTCWDCVWHTDLADAKGSVSYCSLFQEDIHDEGQADDCEAWDPDD